MRHLFGKTYVVSNKQKVTNPNTKNDGTSARNVKPLQPLCVFALMDVLKPSRLVESTRNVKPLQPLCVSALMDVLKPGQLVESARNVKPLQPLFVSALMDSLKLGRLVERYNREPRSPNFRPI